MLKDRFGKTKAHEFLRKLMVESLPITIQDHELIEKLRAYASAGLIKANIPNGFRRGDQMIQAPAEVLEITREGRLTVKRLFNAQDPS